VLFPKSVMSFKPVVSCTCRRKEFSSKCFGFVDRLDTLVTQSLTDQIYTSLIQAFRFVLVNISHIQGSGTRVHQSHKVFIYLLTLRNFDFTSFSPTKADTLVLVVRSFFKKKNVI
jgi:hypothetical protein